MAVKKTVGEERRRNLNKTERQKNQYFISKWGVTEKQLEEALEQTGAEREQELYDYLHRHGYIPE